MIRKNIMMMKRIWNTPEVYYRKGAVSCLKSIEYDSLLILVAESVKNSKYYDKVEKYTKEKSVKTEILTKPTQKEILLLNKKYKNSKPEVIVAIGGGSVIDFAKVLRVFFNYPEMGFEDFHENQFCDNNKVKLIAIPTTPGTGSETTSIAVIFDDKGKKHPYSNHGFIPDLAILDHGFLNSLNKNLIYEFGADIFSHAFEGSVSMMKTPLIEALGKSSISLLKEGFKIYKEKPGNSKALSKILYAGHLAGIVQGNAFVGVCHALAHTMEEQVKVSHGAAIQYLLKPVIKWMINEKNKPEYSEFLKIYEQLGFDEYKKQDLIKNIDIEKWAETALKDPSITTSPIRITKKDKILELIKWIQTNR